MRVLPSAASASQAAARSPSSRSRAVSGLLRPGGLLGVAEVLVEEGLAYPAGARGQVALGEVPEEFVDCVARRRAGVQGWHAQHNSGF